MRLTMTKMLGRLVALAVLGSAAWLAGTTPVLGEDPVWLLQGATIHPMNGQPPFVGAVLIRGEQIEQVAAQIEAPAGAQVIDLTGMHLTPGLIESRGKIWLTAAATSEGAAKAELDVLDAVDPWSEDWRELAAQGITAVQVQPGATGTLGGYGAVLRVAPLGNTESLTLKGRSSVQAALGTKGATSKDRYTQVQALEKLLEAAQKELDKQQAKEKQAKEKKSAEAPAEEKDSAGEGENKPSPESRRRGRPRPDSEGAQDEDQEKEAGDAANEPAKEADDSQDSATTALLAVLKREIPLHLEVHHADALAHALRLAEKYKLRLVLDGLSNVDRLADELRTAAPPVVVGPLVEAGEAPDYRKRKSHDWLSEYARIPGQPWALSTFSSKGTADRLLRVQAAQAIAEGVAPADALRAVTIFPARMLGIAEQVGSIETGKRADIAVFAGDPMNPATPVRLVLSGGQVTFEQNISSTESVERATSVPPAIPPSMPARYAVRSSRTLLHGEFQPQTFLVEDGLIRQAPQDLPADVPLFDFGDHVLSPPLVNAWTSLGQSNAVTDSTESDSSHLAALDAIDPTTEKAREMLAAGFLHVAVAPGKTSTSAGTLGHLRLGSPDFAGNPHLAGQLVLLETARDRERYPASLAGQRMLLGQLLSGEPLSSPIYLGPHLSQLIAGQKQEHLQAMATGKRPAVILADSDAELDAALQLIEAHQLKALLVSRGRLVPHLERIQQLQVQVVVPALQGDEFQPELEQYAQLDQAGVPLLFAGESPQRIRLTAALLASAGVRAQSIRQGLTSGAAEALGMKPAADQPAPADFVVWNGDPLNTAAEPVAIFVDGQPQTLATSDSQE